MGCLTTPIRMNFRKSSEGGGVIFNPKNYIADFCHYRRYFGHEFRKNLQYDFPKMRGGGSKAVWNFSENSSVLDVLGFPKRLPLCRMAIIMAFENWMADADFLKA